MTEEEIKEYFSQWGEVLRVIMPTDENENFKGFCFVEYLEKGSCYSAINAEEHELGGRYLNVSE